MADERIDIEIRTRADTSGAEQAREAIRDVNAEARSGSGDAPLFDVARARGTETALNNVREAASQTSGAMEGAASAAGALGGATGAMGQVITGIGVAALAGLVSGLREASAEMSRTMQESAALSDAILQQASAWEAAATAASSQGDVVDISAKMAPALKKAEEQIAAMQERIATASQNPLRMMWEAMVESLDERSTSEQGPVTAMLNAVTEGMDRQMERLKATQEAVRNIGAALRREATENAAELASITALPAAEQIPALQEKIRALKEEMTGLNATLSRPKLGADATRQLTNEYDGLEAKVKAFEAAKLKALNAAERSERDGFNEARKNLEAMDKAAQAAERDTAWMREPNPDLAREDAARARESERIGKATEDHMAKLGEEFRQRQALLGNARDEQGILRAKLNGQDQLAAKLQIEKNTRDQIETLRKQGLLTPEVQKEIEKTGELQKQLALLQQQKQARQAIQALEDFEPDVTGVEQTGRKGKAARDRATAQFNRQLGRLVRDAEERGVAPEKIDALAKERREDFDDRVREARGRFGKTTGADPNRNLNVSPDPNYHSLGDNPSADFLKLKPNAPAAPSPKPAQAAPDLSKPAQDTAQAAQGAQQAAQGFNQAASALQGMTNDFQSIVSKLQQVAAQVKSIASQVQL